MQELSQSLAFDQVHGEDVARRAVQHVIRGGAEQQRQTMTTMAADHDQIARLFFGEMMDFLAWLAIGQVAVGAFEFGVFELEAFEALFGLIELLLLQL